jgi:sugar lactone lactonase YvrE
VGSSAYLDQPSFLTGCGAKVFFVDLRGLRSLDLQTRQVTTLITGYPQHTSLWCDGKFIYTSATIDAGRLTIEQIDINTLQRSSFAYDATASYTRGRSEHVYGVGRTLFTTDSAAGRLWRIDLSTLERAVVADFGGPLILPDPISVGRGTILYSAGAFWTDGSVVYILRPQPSGLNVNTTALTRIRIDTGETTTLAATNSFNSIHGLGTSLYLGEATVQKFDLMTGQFTPFLALNANIGWSDGESLYFSVSFPEGSIGKVNSATKQITLLAGEITADVDGIGSEARFNIYLLPGDMQIHGDSRFLYVLERFSLRRFDRYTGVLSTVVSNLSYAGGVWTNERYAYIADQFAIRRVDLATNEIRTIAGSLTERGQTDGIGTNARFDYLAAIWGDGDNLYINDFGSAIRKLEITTGRVTTLVRGGGIYRGIWGMGRHLYICDTRMVRRLDLDTLAFETIAGNGGPEGSTDGIGTAAEFTRADGIWGDGVNLFVTDAMRRIRRINLESRRVTTIYNSAEPTSYGIFGDGSHLYLLEGFSLRRYDPEASTLTFATPGQGLSIIDVTPATSLTILHSNILFSAGSEVAGGTAIWGYRNPDGVLVSEAAVAAQRPIRNGRIYAETNTKARTGLAISNPNDVDVSVNFYFTDANGVDRQGGAFLLRAREQLARYLNEAPFSGGDSIDGTLTFAASVPVAAVAIRGLTNERSEFLVTVLPLVDLDSPVTYDSRTMAHFATGGGWTTQVLLINPTDAVISGTAQFKHNNGTVDSALPYMIPARSSRRFVADTASSSPVTGSVLISPSANTPSPTPLAVFGFAPDGTTTTQTGVPATVGTDFATYVESSGLSAAEMTDSGIAIANTTDQHTAVFLRLATSVGQPFGQSASLMLGPHAQVSKFISELFPTLTLPFLGVLHISSSTRISVTGLRGRYNSRHEFIVSTVTPINKRANTSTTPLYLPHLVTGGGFSTRLFLINPSGTWTTGMIQLFSPDGSPFRRNAP